MIVSGAEIEILGESEAVISLLPIILQHQDDLSLSPTKNGFI